MLGKYKNKLRILLVITSDYNNKKYRKTKKKYDDNLKRYHKRYIKMITKLDKDVDLKIKLIGFDGKVKRLYNRLSTTKVFSDIDKMPLGHLRKNIKPTNLSLYADYNKKVSNKGFGYSNKKKALDTIKKLKKEKNRYQLYVVTTMLGRAKNHPNQTKGMRDAIKVFKLWLKKYKDNKKIDKKL